MKKTIISVDGIDGAGKTTFINSLKEAMEKNGVLVESYSPTADTKYGRDAKASIIKNPTMYSENDRVELFTNAFIKLYFEKISKSIASVIILDRSFKSTMAYQNTATNLDDCLDRVEQYFIPDVSLIIDIPVEVSIERVTKRSGELDALEDAKKEELELRRRLLKDSLTEDNSLFGFVLDGTKPTEELVGITLSQLNRIL